ncbi:MAG: DsbA family protein [Gemmatimonadales bacterium]
MGIGGPVSSMQRVGASAFCLLAATTAHLAAQDTTLASRSMGSRTAPVTVYEMADFQCPYCRNFAEQTFPTLRDKYIRTGKVRWVFINFPIPSLHPNATAAAEFAICAARQGKFWQTHDMLYDHQADWESLANPEPYFMSQVKSLGLKQPQLDGCLQSKIPAAVVTDDAAGAERSGAHSTPSFYIEGGILEGAQPLGIFERILDSVYTARTATPAKKR